MMRPVQLLLAGILISSVFPACRAAATPPRLAPRKVVFGHSVRHRPMVAYVLGKGPNVTVIFGGFHGDERKSPDVVWSMLRHLEAAPADLAGRTVILVPVANPDGWAADTRVNADGVDINRNFPVDWRSSRSARYRSGARPESEPETRAIVGLLARFRPGKVVSVHQPLRRMIYTGLAGLRLAHVMEQGLAYPITDHSVRPTPGSFGLYCGEGLHAAIVTLELDGAPTRRTFAGADHALTAAIVCEPLYAHETGGR